nr:hypothetical protein [Arthrobacter sp. KBS0703]
MATHRSQGLLTTRNGCHTRSSRRTAWACRSPVAVSYTHLDVYKRQLGLALAWRTITSGQVSLIHI